MAWNPANHIAPSSQSAGLTRPASHTSAALPDLLEAWDLSRVETQDPSTSTGHTRTIQRLAKLCEAPGTVRGTHLSLKSHNQPKGRGANRSLVRAGDPLSPHSRSTAGPHSTPTLSARGLDNTRGPFPCTPPPGTPGGCSTCPQQSGSHSLCSCGRQRPWADGICSLKRYLSFHSLRASRAIKGHARRQVHKCSIETEVVHTQGLGLAVNCQECHPEEQEDQCAACCRAGAGGGPRPGLCRCLGKARCSLKVKARWDPAQASPDVPRPA